MGEKFICKRCGNSDVKYIGYLNGKPYCRRCITFNSPAVEYTKREKVEVKYKLDFDLSMEQLNIAKTLKENYLNGKNTLLNAVCGAGKTEIVYELISYVLSNGGRVGFAIPRRDVVIELLPRISNAFPTQKVVAVYGGHTSSLVGDITILTTHQLYRYNNYFDLLIIDEIDAFPFQNNELLQAFFKKSIRTNYVLMSATPSDKIIEEFELAKDSISYMYKRFHNHPIPVPKLVLLPKTMQIYFIYKKIKEYQKIQKPVLIFTPTIDDAKALYDVFKIFIKNIDYVHSKRLNRDEIVKKFKTKDINILITTSILERGITVENLQVIIFMANHPLFNNQNLTQIAGRVGRKTKYPDGDVYYLANESNSEIEKSINNINEANKHL